MLFSPHFPGFHENTGLCHFYFVNYADFTLSLGRSREMTFAEDLIPYPNARGCGIDNQAPTKKVWP
jgi:hypothetical protein